MKRWTRPLTLLGVILRLGLGFTLGSHRVLANEQAVEIKATEPAPLGGGGARVACGLIG